MKTIWKFSLELTDEQDVVAPEGGKLLSVQEQNGQLYLWALVDSDAEKIPYRISIVGTGHNAIAVESKRYVGTVQTAGGTLVWHVFVDNK